MSVNRTTKVALFGSLALTLGIGLAAPAQARVFVGVGFGFPWVVGAPWYYPPAYYVPPPVVYLPPPVAYQPQQQAYAAPQEQVWYYCRSPKGYYPYVSSCRGGWRSVPATPPQAAR